MLPAWPGVLQCAMPVTPFTPRPVTGDAFIGRQGLVRNLRGRISKGESAAVLGGPKLGKTSFVRTAMEGLPDRCVIDIDLRREAWPGHGETSGAIVLLDNLDHLPAGEIGRLLERISTASPTNLLITGGSRLGTLLRQSSIVFPVALRLYPLSVLLDAELRRWIGGDLGKRITMWTGHHPYLTQIFLHYGEAALSEGRQQWEPFLQELAAEIGAADERRLLEYLIDRAQPVNPMRAAADTGIPDIKTVADRLVYLGAISRWIRNDEATLFAGCRLLNNVITGRPVAA